MLGCWAQWLVHPHDSLLHSHGLHGLMKRYIVSARFQYPRVPDKSASTTAEEASAKSAVARASASTIAKEAGASNATGRAFASTTAEESGAINAAGRAARWLEHLALQRLLSYKDLLKCHRSVVAVRSTLLEGDAPKKRPRSVGAMNTEELWSMLLQELRRGAHRGARGAMQIALEELCKGYSLNIN